MKVDVPISGDTMNQIQKQAQKRGKGFLPHLQQVIASGANRLRALDDYHPPRKRKAKRSRRK
jgi:hypothetical protein